MENLKKKIFGGGGISFSFFLVYPVMSSKLTAINVEVENWYTLQILGGPLIILKDLSILKLALNNGGGQMIISFIFFNGTVRSVVIRFEMKIEVKRVECICQLKYIIKTRKIEL